MDEANVMRAKIFEVYNACSDEVKTNFTKILPEIKLWVKGLKSASSDPEVYRQQISPSHGIWVT